MSERSNNRRQSDLENQGSLPNFRRRSDFTPERRQVRADWILPVDDSTRITNGSLDAARGHVNLHVRPQDSPSTPRRQENTDNYMVDRTFISDAPSNDASHRTWQSGSESQPTPIMATAQDAVYWFISEGCRAGPETQDSSSRVPRRPRQQNRDNWLLDSIPISDAQLFSFPETGVPTRAVDRTPQENSRQSPPNASTRPARLVAVRQRARQPVNPSNTQSPQIVATNENANRNCGGRPLTVACDGLLQPETHAHPQDNHPNVSAHRAPFAGMNIPNSLGEHILAYMRPIAETERLQATAGPSTTNEPRRTSIRRFRNFTMPAAEWTYVHVPDTVELPNPDDPYLAVSRFPFRSNATASSNAGTFSRRRPASTQQRPRRGS